MLRLHHESTLNFFIDKYDISNLFEIDFKKHMELHCFHRDEIICMANQSLEYLYFLVDGTANSYTDFSSKQSNIHTLYTPFSTIGELEFFNKSNFTYNIKTLEECIFIGIHRDIINDFLINDRKFLKYFCNIFSDRLSCSNSELIDFKNNKRNAM